MTFPQHRPLDLPGLIAHLRESGVPAWIVDVDPSFDCAANLEPGAVVEIVVDAHVAAGEIPPAPTVTPVAPRWRALSWVLLTIVSVLMGSIAGVLFAKLV
jgi:hypothetical protein